MRPKKREEVTFQTVGTECLVLDTTESQLHRLNHTACFILEQCDGEKTVEQIAKRITEHFDIDLETATVDTEETISQLQLIKIVGE